MFNRIIPVKQIKQLNECYFILSVEIGAEAMNIQPGQFFELKRPDYAHPLLRKPISVYNVQDDTVLFMIKRLGKATEQFAQMQPGDPLDLLGPLGNSFPVPDGKAVLLVSGGIGYPPLFFLKKQLEQAGKSVYWLHGGRQTSDIFACDDTWTDDGYLGNKGFVTEGLQAYLHSQKPDVIYACGPAGLLKTCHDLTAKHEIPLYVSLESYMACGIGVCHGCAIKVKSDNAIGVTYKTVCKDGPVFDSQDIMWD